MNFVDFPLKIEETGYSSNSIFFFSKTIDLVVKFTDRSRKLNILWWCDGK